MHVHLRARKLSNNMREMLGVEQNDLDQMIQENKDLLPLFLTLGITSAHDMGSDIIDSLQVWRSQIQSGKLLGLSLYLTGPKIEGHHFPFYKGSIIVESEVDIDPAVAKMREWNVDGVKIMGGVIEPLLFYKTIEAVENAGLRTYTHNIEIISAQQASDLGLDAIAHMRCANYKSFESYDSLACSMWGRRIVPPDPEYMATFGSVMTEEYDTSILERNLGQLADTGTALISTLYYREYEPRPEAFEEVFYAPLKYVGSNFERIWKSGLREWKRLLRRAGRIVCGRMNFIRFK